MWKEVPDRILNYAERLRDAQIENRPAVDLIERYRYPQVLIYADPPYVLSTRKGRMYANEMADQDHIELIEALERHPGPVLLSGYACDVYDSRLQHWTKKMRQAKAEKGRERTEVLWLNPVAARSMGTLFA
jgi:DNA adenine methylase